MKLYDKIGKTYDQTRTADPYILDTLHRLLQMENNRKYLDIACGTGNYTIGLAKKNDNATIYGVDQSEWMISSAKRKSHLPNLVWMVDDAAHLHFESNFFDGIVCTQAIHHFDNFTSAFKEMYRVLKGEGGRFVIFSSTKEQMDHYWLKYYFPKMMEKSIRQMPSSDDIIKSLTEAGFVHIQSLPYSVTEDLEDLFLYSGKTRPEIYLHPEVRAGISSFANLSDSKEIESGLQLLKEHIDSGYVWEVISDFDLSSSDYTFFVAQK